MKIKDVMQSSFIMYIVCVGGHWITTNMYAQLCTPFDTTGFVKSLFLSQSTHCSLLRWLQQQVCYAMDHAFYLSVSWCVSQVSYRMTNKSLERLRLPTGTMSQTHS